MSAAFILRPLVFFSDGVMFTFTGRKHTCSMSVYDGAASCGRVTMSRLYAPAAASKRGAELLSPCEKQIFRTVF